MSRVPAWYSRPRPCQPWPEVVKPVIDETALQELRNFDYIVATNVLADSARLIRDRITYDLERPQEQHTGHPMFEQLRYAAAARILDNIATDMERTCINYQPRPDRPFCRMEPQEARAFVIKDTAETTDRTFYDMARCVGDALLSRVMDEKRPEKSFNRLSQAERAVDMGQQTAYRIFTEVIGDMVNDAPCRNYPGAALERHEAICDAASIIEEVVGQYEQTELDPATAAGKFEYAYKGQILRGLETMVHLFAHGKLPPAGQGDVSAANMQPLALAGTVLTEMGIPQGVTLNPRLKAKESYQEDIRLQGAESARATQLREVMRAASMINQSLRTGKLSAQALQDYKDISPEGEKAPMNADVVQATMVNVRHMMIGIVENLDVAVRQADKQHIDKNNPHVLTTPRTIAVPTPFMRH